MEKGRLEAFSDGVFAIIITIMVLDLKIPREPTFEALFASWPIFLCYVLSFIYVGIYWNNHHHLFQVVEKVTGWVLWANLSLLFALSLTPFATAWMGENHFAAVPVMVYGFVLILNSIAFAVLVRTLLATHASDSVLAQAIGTDRKGTISTILYVIGVVASYWWPLVGCLLFGAVAIIWLVPDRRIEKRITAGPRT